MARTGWVPDPCHGGLQVFTYGDTSEVSTSATESTGSDDTDFAVSPPERRHRMTTPETFWEQIRQAAAPPSPTHTSWNSASQRLVLSSEYEFLDLTGSDSEVMTYDDDFNVVTSPTFYCSTNKLSHQMDAMKSGLNNSRTANRCELFDSTCEDTDFTLASDASNKLAQSSYFEKAEGLQRNIRKPSWLKVENTFKVGKRRTPKKKIKISPNRRALLELRDLERAPTHKWNDEERELMCVIWRFYLRDTSAFKKVFNSIMGLDLSERKVKGQMENHIQLHGGVAYPMYAGVFSTPLDDPTGLYEPTRQLIEAHAKSLDIDLERALFEEALPSTSGKASSAKAIRTRRLNKQLVLKGGSQANPSLNESGIPHIPSPNNLNLRGIAIHSPEQFEKFVQEEYSKLISPYSAQLPVLTPASSASFQTVMENKIPSLAFRVWDGNSNTHWDQENGFVAGIFAIRHGHRVASPLPRTHSMFDVHANSHFHKKDTAPSAFVSVSSSLIQVLKYAAAMKEPMLCLINLEAAELQVQDKIHWAKDIIEGLRSKGDMAWTRYRGEQELLIWGSIPPSAMISQVEVTDIEEVAGNSLHLELFDKGLRTSTLARTIRQQRKMMGVYSARKMAHLAKLCGLGQENVPSALNHIQEFITYLVDGWSIRGEPTLEVVNTFVRTLNSVNLTSSEVSDALLCGIRQGNSNIDKYTKSNPSNRA